MKTFEELGLSNEMLGILSDMKIKIPSEIQEKTIPLVLAGRDVIGGSATGSGKTLAFASGIIENLQKNGRVQALILTPTRELAEQVASSIKKFSKHEKLNILPIYGGVDINNQIRKIPNTDVIVGTPGRILDHLQRNTLNLGKVKFLVLDEVDRMFDMGFQKDVEKIISECPTKRQTMLFSATISSEMDYLSKKHTKKPVEISVESHIEPSKLKQIYYNVPDGLKFSLFVHLLKQEKGKLVMIFCGTRNNVDFVANNLNNIGINAKAIHGGMMQNKRNNVMGDFNSKNSVNVLVCTDVAARGLDIKDVSHVYNYDLPKTSSEYIHRIGRTARAGKDGIAISVLCSRDYENFSNILKDEKLKINEIKTPWCERIPIIIQERKGFGRQREGSNFNRGRDSAPRRGFGRNNSGGRKSFGGQKRSSNFSRGRNSESGKSYGKNENSGRKSFSRGRSESRENDNDSRKPRFNSRDKDSVSTFNGRRKNKDSPRGRPSTRRNDNLKPRQSFGRRS